jgi:plastocyanin
VCENDSTLEDLDDGSGDKLLTIRGANMPERITLKRGTRLCVVNGDADAVHYVYAPELAFVPELFQYPMDYEPSNKADYLNHKAVGGTTEALCFDVIQPSGEYELLCEVHADTQFAMKSVVVVEKP